MPTDTSGVDRALGAIGTTFRLIRLYPPTHPAVVEAMRHITAALPALAAFGSVEWKVGATGFHWYGQQLLPRNLQVSELAGLLYARGVRTVQAHPGMTAEHVLALFGVATGGVPPDDPSLGRLTLGLGRRSLQRLSAARHSGPVPGVTLFRPDVVPPDVEARRAIAALRPAQTPEAQRAAVDRLRAVAADLLALRDAAVVAEAIAGLDGLLGTLKDADLVDAVGAAAAALADGAMVERMVKRLGEVRVPPAERAALVNAVGALAAVATNLVLEAFLAAPADLREPYRAAIRVAADRAIEPLEARLADKSAETVATAAQFLGLTGSPNAIPLLIPLVRHARDTVREAALLALAEIGGREITRPAIPPLKDESVLVRAAAARAIGVGGDPSASTVLIRRLDQEEDEGVLAELLKAIGRLGAKETLEVLAKYAEPGGRLKRRTAFVRAAAIEALGMLSRPEVRGLLELYSQDKDPAVKRAAEAVLR